MNPILGTICVLQVYVSTSFGLSMQMIFYKFIILTIYRVLTSKFYIPRILI